MSENNLISTSVDGALPSIVWKGQRVITTNLLADYYETNTHNIQSNFKKNKDNFATPKHYYLLQGEDLKNLQSAYSALQISPMTRQYYLWTESGALRHCKILDTNKAWDKFDELVEVYFRAKDFSEKVASGEIELKHNDPQPDNLPKYLTYRGKPCLKIRDIANFFEVSRPYILKIISDTLARGTDCQLLCGGESKEFRKENNIVVTGGKIHVIYASGFEKIQTFFKSREDKYAVMRLNANRPQTKLIVTQATELTPDDIKKKFNVKHSNAQLDAELQKLIEMDRPTLVYRALAQQARLKVISRLGAFQDLEAITASIFPFFEETDLYPEPEPLFK